MKRKQHPKGPRRECHLVNRQETGGTQIHYLERRQEPKTSRSAHRIHQNGGCMVRTPLRKKYPIRHHRLENSQREIWTQKKRGKNPKPIPMKERPQTTVGGRKCIR